MFFLYLFLSVFIHFHGAKVASLQCHGIGAFSMCRSTFNSADFGVHSISKVGVLCYFTADGTHTRSRLICYSSFLSLLPFFFSVVSIHFGSHAILIFFSLFSLAAKFFCLIRVVGSCHTLLSIQSTETSTFSHRIEFK